MCSPIRFLTLGFKTLATPPILTIPIPRTTSFPHQIHPNRLSIPIQSSNPRKFLIYATEQNNSGQNRLENDDVSNNNGNDNNGGSDDELKSKNGRSGLNWNVNWGKLILDPDPDNVLAVGLTGLLTWASVQVVWQLVVVSIAIVIAGLKYSIVAALLIFILIALL